MVPRRSRCAAIAWSLSALLALAPMFAGPAAAKSHLWKFKEIFSNADGSVQYIEMDVLDPAGTGEWVTVNQVLASRDNTFVIPTNLPNENTFQRSMLFATPAFAALPGAPAPDFVIPAGFLDPDGDELRYRFTLDLFAFGAGELPVDGRHALARVDRSQPLNTPENFAGATGTIDVGTPVNGPWPPLAVAALLLAAAYQAERVRRRRNAERSFAR